MSFDYLEPLVSLLINVPSVPKRLDVGVTQKCNGIPLFHSTRGEIYPMLYVAVLGRGSTSYQGDLPDGCRTVTYPTVLQHTKVSYKHASICAFLFIFAYYFYIASAYTYGFSLIFHTKELKNLHKLAIVFR